MRRLFWSELGAGRVDFVLRGAGVLVVAGVLAGGGAYVVGDGGGGDPGTANIWVDGSGTCVDNASPVEYDSATACATFDAANDTCEGGDTVIVKGGSYSNQSITGDNGRSSTCNFGVVEGETVDMGTTDDFISGGLLDICGAYLSFQGTTSRADALTKTVSTPSTSNVGPRDGFDIFEIDMSLGGSCSSDVHHVEFHDISTSGVFFTGQHHITIEGGEIGPRTCNGSAEDDSEMMTFKSRPTDFGFSGTHIVHDILIDGVIFHDQIRPSSGCPDHMDMIQWYNGQNMTIRNSQFLRAEDQMLFGRCETDGCIEGEDSLDNWLIENNFFDSCCQNTSSSETLSMSSSGAVPCTDIVVRYNTLRSRAIKLECTDTDDPADGVPDVSATNIQAYGNLTFVKPTVCSDATWSYNFYASSGTTTCSGTGENAWDGTGTIMTDVANQDFTLTAGSDARTEGSPSACPATDWDGGTRPDPGGTTCDAGADEVG